MFRYFGIALLLLAGCGFQLRGAVTVPPEMAKTYLIELARRRGEVTADVTTARDIDEAQKQAIIAALRPYAGEKVTLDLKVDPGLIGGMVPAERSSSSCRRRSISIYCSR